jgi:hypothetical protein
MRRNSGLIWNYIRLVLKGLSPNVISTAISAFRPSSLQNFLAYLAGRPQNLFSDADSTFIPFAAKAYLGTSLFAGKRRRIMAQRKKLIQHGGNTGNRAVPKMPWETTGNIPGQSPET